MLKEVGKYDSSWSFITYKEMLLNILIILKSLGHTAVEVKTKKDLDAIDALILPGGESTTIGSF